MATIKNSQLSSYHISDVSLSNQNEMKLDLHFIYTTLLENHPGAIVDPDFCPILEDNYAWAISNISSCVDKESRIRILTEFIKRFDDPHLFVTFYTNSWTYQNETFFTLKEINPNMAWVSLPTFAPDLLQANDLKDVISKLSLLPQDRIIVFDLRGNNGGNSEWGTKVIQALFGNPYVKNQFYEHEAKNDSKLIWRVSEGNLTFLEGITEAIKETLGSDSRQVLDLKNICSEIKKCSELGKQLYLHREIRGEKASDVTKKNFSQIKNRNVYAVIDSKCASSTLIFIDELRMMGSSLTLIGEPTNFNTPYMVVRPIELPSKLGMLCFPIRKDPRQKQRYVPDIDIKNKLEDSQHVLNIILDEQKKTT